MTPGPRLRLRHPRAIHAGQRPDPYTGRARSRSSRPPATSSRTRQRGRLLQPAGVRQHLLADHEPDRRGAGGADREPRGRAGAVAFASGLAAQAAVFFTLFEPGDHVVASRALYGGSLTQLKHVFRKLSVDLDFVDPSDLEAWRRAARPETKAFFGETIGNPAGTVLDLEAVAAIAHELGAPLVVDNTFATPYLCRPIDWGADIVVHSATKFLGGHGTSIGGVVVDSGRFDWSNGRFPRWSPIRRRPTTGSRSTRRSASTAS